MNIFKVTRPGSSGMVTNFSRYPWTSTKPGAYIINCATGTMSGGTPIPTINSLLQAPGLDGYSLVGDEQYNPTYARFVIPTLSIGTGAFTYAGFVRRTGTSDWWNDYLFGGDANYFSPFLYAGATADNAGIQIGASLISSTINCGANGLYALVIRRTGTSLKFRINNSTYTATNSTSVPTFSAIVVNRLNVAAGQGIPRANHYLHALEARHWSDEEVDDFIANPFSLISVLLPRRTWLHNRWFDRTIPNYPENLLALESGEKVTFGDTDIIDPTALASEHATNKFLAGDGTWKSVGEPLLGSVGTILNKYNYGGF